MCIRDRYSELTQKIDTLTHLLNRRSYESRPASLRGQAVIYYFDVDEFKSVNDTFGHGVGDAVLAEVGSTIYAVFSKAGYCYRIGGDEFCVIAGARNLKWYASCWAGVDRFCRDDLYQNPDCLLTNASRCV